MWGRDVTDVNLYRSECWGGMGGHGLRAICSQILHTQMFQFPMLFIITALNSDVNFRNRTLLTYVVILNELNIFCFEGGLEGSSYWLLLCWGLLNVRHYMFDFFLTPSGYIAF